MVEKIKIKSKNGNNLNCIVSKPDKVEGLVISSQGFGSTTKSKTYQMLLEELPKKGFIIIVFEFQGLGESEGKVEEKTATRDLEDIKAVVDYAFNNFEFDKEKFFIFGSSFGGFTALNFVLRDNRTKALVIRAPVSNFNQTNDKLRSDRKYILDYDAFLEDGKKYDIYSRASEIKIPVKIIHGNKDEMVPITQSEKLVSELPNADLIVVEEVGHRFEGKEEEVYKKIIKFFEEMLL